MLKLVIFDMDGLMFDTERVNCQAFHQVVRRMGYEPTMQQYLQLIGLSKKDTVEAYRRFYGAKTDAEQIYYEVGKEAKQIRDIEGVPVKDGLYGLLDVLEAFGIEKAVASSSSKDVIEHCLKDSHIFNRMQYIISAQQVSRGKPFPDIFLQVCEQAGCQPEEAVVLEDSVNGLKAAIAAKIPAIAVPDMLSIPAEIQRQLLGMVNSLADVPKVLKL